jgi:hypothetical protein
MNNKYLIIAVLAAVIVCLCGGIVYTLLSENTEYITTTIAESGTTMEIPNDMVIKSNDTGNGILVLENDNTIIVIFNSADKGLAQLMAYASLKSPIFGNSGNANLTLKNPAIAGCSLEGDCNAVIIGNNDTHDNIIVISKSKDIVSHIINSIIWSKKTATTTESSDNQASSSDTSNSEPSAYAYKSDGTPMHSEDEVRDYMLDKYGVVEYHVGDNGYIDMDEPGYDDAGNKIDEDK